MSNGVQLPIDGASPIGSVLVLGLGKTGKSVARYCTLLLGSRVSSLFIAAGARNDDSLAFVESLVGAGVEYAFGDDALDSLGDRRFDLCIASPGIPFWHDLYVRGKQLSAELISEVEFAWRESSPDSIWVAITGTNGKTTTTSCCAHVLRECGYAANAVGNIGDVCLDAVVAGDTAVYVAEVSSYQLYSAPTFAPDVAVMLNITPDHIHWHQTLEAYRDAKFQLLDNLARFGCRTGADALAGSAEVPAPQTGKAAVELSACGGSDSPRSRFDLTSSQLQKRPQGHSPLPNSRMGRPVAILDATNDVVRAKVRELRQLADDERGYDYIPLGTADGIHGDMRAKCGADNASFLDDKQVMRVAFDGVEHVLADAADLQIAGEHNASNALAAATVAVVLGADDEAIARSLCSFKPLEHRIEPCGEVDGVTCYNDSKATNVDATLKALAAFPGKRVHVLLGGDDKGTDLSDLVAATCKHAQTAVCFGDAGPRFAKAFAESAGLHLMNAEHLEDALDAALSVAKPGDVVLLSPACASFDEFKSFEQRGEVFKQLVAKRADAVAQEA